MIWFLGLRTVNNRCTSSCVPWREKLRRCVSSTIIKPNSAFDNDKGLARQLCKPHMTFHGTGVYPIPSIVRWGFEKPGELAGSKAVIMLWGSSLVLELILPQISSML